MSDPAQISTGRCRCGQVSFSLTGPELVTMACHCRGCQRLTGGPYSLSILFPRDAYVQTAGELDVGGLHGASRYMMCTYCKSWIYTEPEGMPLINIRTPLLDHPPAEPPFVEVATSEGFEWAQTRATHAFAHQPDPEAFPRILEEYASRNSG